jgi:hypothetical protein
LKGALLLARGDQARALDFFRAAVATARLQGASLLELKAANSLADVLLKRGELREAKATLLEAVGRMPEGEACPELDKPGALLERHDKVAGNVISDQTLS